MSSVQLNAYGVQDEVTGTLVLTVHDPLKEVSSVGFYVTDGAGTRSARLGADRIPSPGVYEKDVLLDLNGETRIEPDVALADGTVLKPGPESFSRNSAQVGRLQVGPGVEAWMHNPYADEVGAPTAHISRLEVGAKKSANSNQPAILRIHQSGSGAAEFFKPLGKTLQLRETPGGSGTWFTHFLVNGASVRATGHIQTDSYVYAHWNSAGRRMRMGEIYGVAGLHTPDSEMKFNIEGTGPFRFTFANAERMSVHGDGWMHLHGGLHVSRGNATGGGIVLADDGDIVDLNDSYCSMRFTNGVRIFSGNRGGSPVITLASSGQVHANALYVNTSAGQIRTDLGGASDILFANTNRTKAMWVGTGPTFETGPRIGFYGDSNTFRPGQVWFTIGGTPTPRSRGSAWSDVPPPGTPEPWPPSATRTGTAGGRARSRPPTSLRRRAVRSRRTSPRSRTTRSAWSTGSAWRASTTSPTRARTGASASSPMRPTSCSPARSGTGSTFRTRSGSSSGRCSNWGIGWSSWGIGWRGWRGGPEPAPQDARGGPAREDQRTHEE
jgi:hypothetical protein